MGKLSTETLQERKSQLEKVIGALGNPYQASKVLKVSPAAIYERCRRYGIVLKPHQVPLLPGEPANRNLKKIWLKKQLATYTVAELARKCDRSYGAIVDRIRRYHIIYKAPRPHAKHGEPFSPAGRKRWLKHMLKEHNQSITEVAKILNVTPSALYQRCTRYGIEL